MYPFLPSPAVNHPLRSNTNISVKKVINSTVNNLPFYSCNICQINTTSTTWNIFTNISRISDIFYTMRDQTCPENPCIIFWKTFKSGFVKIILSQTTPIQSKRSSSILILFKFYWTSLSLIQYISFIKEFIAMLSHALLMLCLVSVNTSSCSVARITKGLR